MTLIFIQVDEESRAQEQFREMVKPTMCFKTVNKHRIMQLFSTAGK
jgi:hypothetical protein